MPRVSGIGGLFVRSSDPEALALWYQSHFGIGNGADGMPWQQDAGLTVFAPFTEESDYFRTDRRFMLNLRVDDLAAFVVDLRAAGITVRELPAEGYGLFAHLEDPEGNPIELWQPLEG